MKVKITRNKYGIETIHYSKNMTTQDCIDVLKKRTEKRANELNLYKLMYDKFLSLQKKQNTDLNWLIYLEKHPTFLEDNEN